MMQRIFGIALVAFLFVAFTSVASSQEAAKKETQKEAKKEDVRAYKSVSCDPECGFMVRSHDEKEHVSIVKLHAKNVHGSEMTDDQVKKLVKTEEAKEKKKTKEMKKAGER